MYPKAGRNLCVWRIWSWLVRRAASLHNSITSWGFVANIRAIGLPGPETKVFIVPCPARACHSSCQLDIHQPAVKCILWSLQERSALYLTAFIVFKLQSFFLSPDPDTSTGQPVSETGSSALHSAVFSLLCLAVVPHSWDY